MTQPTVKIVCDTCGKPAPLMDDNGKWARYDTSRPCACGGRFGARVNLDAEPNTDAEVNAYLRADGADPDKIGREGREFVGRKMEEAMRLATRKAGMEEEQ